MKTTNPKQTAVHNRLRSLRLDAGLSQEELAKAAGIDRKTVNRIENGHFSPNLDTFFRLCVALNVRPSEIMKGLK